MLIDDIRQHASESAEAGEFEAVAKKLSEPTIVIRDATPASYARLGETLGDMVRQLVAGTIRTIAASAHPLAGEVGDAHVVLLNAQVGLRIDSDERQQTIDLLAAAGQWPDAVRDAIKSQGKRMESPAGRTVTADECREAWQADRLAARITNANALAVERIKPGADPEQQSAIWAQCWKDGV